jgi:hypothetical protein
VENLEELADYYRKARDALAPEDGQRWIMLIKELRATNGYGIAEAERDALSQPAWRRWVERQINSDPKCAKSARFHIRYRGADALIEERDGRYVIR